MTPTLLVAAFVAAGLVALPPAVADAGGDGASWEPGWELQDPGVAVVYRTGDEILVPNPVGMVFGGITELSAPCDPFDSVNGLDGRWYARPKNDTGVPFQGYYVRAELANAAAPYLIVAYYRLTAGGLCYYQGWDYGWGSLQHAFPPTTTHMLIMTLLPDLAEDLHGSSAGQAQLYMEACKRPNCYWSPALGETKTWYEHPSPTPLDLPP